MNSRCELCSTFGWCLVAQALLHYLSKDIRSVDLLAQGLGASLLGGLGLGHWVVWAGIGSGFGHQGLGSSRRVLLDTWWKICSRAWLGEH